MASSAFFTQHPHTLSVHTSISLQPICVHPSISQHPLIDEYFRHFEASSGRFIPTAALRQAYPEELEAPADGAGTIRGMKQVRPFLLCLPRRLESGAGCALRARVR